jgi:hypothetical protein
MRFIIGSRSYGYLWIACSVTLVIPAAGPRGKSGGEILSR